MIHTLIPIKAKPYITTVVAIKAKQSQTKSSHTLIPIKAEPYLNHYQTKTIH